MSEPLVSEESGRLVDEHEDMVLESVVIRDGALGLIPAVFAESRAALLAHIATITKERQTFLDDATEWELDNVTLTAENTELLERLHVITANNDRLYAELEEARRDTERLDFISDPNHRAQFDGYGTPTKNWTIYGLQSLPQGRTLRAAIDAARSSVKEGK